MMKFFSLNILNTEKVTIVELHVARQFSSKMPIKENLLIKVWLKLVLIIMRQ